ncbi:hypothetical protein GCM10009037_29580 [Halarchaeum grantii]|uniref:Uncharacterized protein n=1 Tax=Halarchaeum grantii TaxID=1193105 RepID=A0A830F0X3_9EURY|nr:hypothetical protein [Halarchaeum grantii]GGL44279.1 hypothetical protein GCM10009037_29580 [Halarchaeum grantii]
MVLGFSGSQLFGVGLAVIGMVVLAFSGRYVWRATGIYRAAAVSTLGETTPGTLVRISGTAQQGEADLLSAPFSGRDCLALRYAVEERRLSPVLLPWFVTIHELAGSDTFRLRTSEADIDIVEPAHTVTLERNIVATVPPSDDPPERIERFERGAAAVPVTTYWREPPSLLQPITRLLSIGTRRYSEQRATPGDDLTVVGRVTERRDGVNPLVVSDRPPRQTFLRMTKTSLVGLCIGVFVVVLGLVLVLL